MSDDLAAAKETAWRELRDLDIALEQGRIDKHGWHEAVRAIVEPAYLSGENPRAQSGHSGDAARWEQARRLLIDALPGDCALLDVGCANGHLMESIVAWAAEDDLRVEPYGVEISGALAELARQRLPQWADRIWTANAMNWLPGRRFDVVRTGLEYVPPPHRHDFVAHLLDYVVAAGGRLVVGVYNEERNLDTIAAQLGSWGYVIAGQTQRPHRHPEVAYKALWVNTPHLG